MLNYSQLSAIAPNAPKDKLDLYASEINKATQEFEINTSLRLAAFLAIGLYETGELSAFREIGADNAEYAPYVGRGFFQLTWESGYRVCGDYFDVDFVSKPQLVEQPAWAFRTAAWFFRNANGDLNNFADDGDFWDCYLRVAGADNGTFPQRKAFYDKALEVLGNEETGVTVTGQDIVNAARELVGIPYRVWRVGDPIPLWSEQYPQGPPPISWIQARGIDCSDLVSYALQRCGLPAIGGTGDIANSIVGWSRFDASTPGEVGAVAVTAYQGPALAEQGHVLIMTGEHSTIQSLFGDGVTEQYTDQDTVRMLSLDWYGFLPGINYSGELAPEPTEDTWQTYGWYQYVSATSWDLKKMPPVKG